MKSHETLMLMILAIREQDFLTHWKMFMIAGSWKLEGFAAEKLEV